MFASLLSLALAFSAPVSLPTINNQEELQVMPLNNIAAIAASDEIVTDPEGEEALYVMNCGIITNWGMFDYPSLKSVVRFDPDGETVYFHNLFPRYHECWVKGTIDGNEVVIASGQTVYHDATYGDVYFYASYDAGDGIFNTVDEMRLTMSEDDYGRKHIKSSDNTILGGIVKDDQDGMGYLVLNGYYQMDEFLDPIWQVPEELVKEDYTLSYKDYYWIETSTNVEVAFDGDDVYLHGLIPDADKSSGWVKGTIQGDSLCIPSCQGAYSSTYLLSFFAGYAAQYDEYGDPMFASKDTLKLAIDEDRKTFTSVDGDYALTVYGNRQALIYAFEKIKYAPYGGDVPAVPSAPIITSVTEYYIGFTLENKDIDGNYLNSNNLTYSVFFDDELFTFSPDDYIYLTEETTELGWAFTDSYDIMAYASDHMFYIYDLLFSTVGIQAYYTVDGIRNASEMGYWSVNPEGLMQVEKGQKVIRCEYFDLTGRHLLTPQGTCLRKAYLNDGSVKSEIISVK